MDFTDEDIEEFIAIWEREFGERITPDRARMEAGLLIELYWALIQPLPGGPQYREDEIED